MFDTVTYSARRGHLLCSVRSLTLLGAVTYSSRRGHLLCSARSLTLLGAVTYSAQRCHLLCSARSLTLLGAALVLESLNLATLSSLLLQVFLQLLLPQSHLQVAVRQRLHTQQATRSAHQHTTHYMHDYSHVDTPLRQNPLRFYFNACVHTCTLTRQHPLTCMTSSKSITAATSHSPHGVAVQQAQQLG